MKRFRHIFKTFQAYLFSKTALYITLLAAFFFTIIYSCGHRFLNRNVDVNDENTLSRLENYSKQQKKYFILHDSNEVVHLNDIFIDEENQQLQAYTTIVDYGRNVYQPDPGEKTIKYKKQRGNPVHEIHLFSNSDLNLTTGKNINIPFKTIDSINVYDPDIGHQVISIVGITVGTLAVITAIAIATKSSCPFVYSDDGEKYVFEGELYPGATRPTMEKFDYFQLKHLKQKNGLYSIKVANELMEIQHTNSLQLFEVIHPENTSVMIDQYGTIHSVGNPVQPLVMRLGKTEMDLEMISGEDFRYVQFNAVHEQNDFQSLYLKFNNPEQSNQAKLVLTLKNSYWMDYTFGEFYEKFGSSFNTFQKNYRNQPKEESMKWMREQGLFLDVEIKNGNEWEKVESLNLVGPLKNRDVVVPLQLENHHKTDLEIRLNCGFMFWDIDKIGIDYSENESFTVNKQLPVYAINKNGQEITSTIINADDNYLVQPEIGDFAEVKFKASDLKSGMKTSLFLENTGYYEYIRNFEGTANLLELQKFKKPGAFTRFSKDKYFEFIMGEKSLNELASTGIK